MRRSIAGMGLLVVLAGCFNQGKTGLFPSGGAFDAASQPQSPETREAQLRIATIGQKILDANLQLDKRVVFAAAGRPAPEVFHRSSGDLTEIWVTNGLVNECKTDGQLAAVLCQELGKVTNEKAAHEAARRAARDEHPLPPLRIGNEPGGGLPNDPVAVRELADADRRRKENAAATTALPPETLARSYLRATGYSASDYEAAVPLLRKAEQNDACAEQITGASTSQDRTPRPF